MKQYNVGVIGATGMVGQRFLTLLENHPYFEVTCLAASARSAGKTFTEAVGNRWRVPLPMPEYVKDMVIVDSEDIETIKEKCDFVFCAIDMDKATLCGFFDNDRSAFIQSAGGKPPFAAVTPDGADAEDLAVGVQTTHRIQVCRAFVLKNLHGGIEGIVVGAVGDKYNISVESNILQRLGREAAAAEAVVQCFGIQMSGDDVSVRVAVPQGIPALGDGIAQKQYPKIMHARLDGSAVRKLHAADHTGNMGGKGNCDSFLSGRQRAADDLGAAQIEKGYRQHIHIDLELVA